MKYPDQAIKVIIADDHEVLREGFCSIIKKFPWVQVVAQATNGLEAVQMMDEFMPDVIIMDIQMPVMGGIQATQLITKKYPDVGVLAFSMFHEDSLILQMLEAGAKGYLVKNAHKKEIIEALEALYNQQSYFVGDISIKMMKIIAESRLNKKKPKEAEFNEREKQVINLLCRQFFTKEISEAMNLSPRTIEGYREGILRKMNARNSVGIVLYAIENKLYDPAETSITPGK